MFEIFIGIVEGPNEGSVSIGIIDVRLKVISARSFPISKESFNNYFIQSDNGSFTMKANSDLSEIVNYFDTKILDPRKVQVLIEVPKVVPYPVDDPDSKPCALLDYDSIFLKMVALLFVKRYIALILMADDSGTKFLIGHIPNQPEYENLKSFQPKFIGQGIAKTHGDILLGSCKFAEKAAIIAALIAKNNGAYSYWSSFGRVQSSQDVLLYLKNGQKIPTSVLSANELYTISINESTKYEGLEKIPIEYAVASKKSEHLGENNAIKVGLLHVCNLWGIQLRCKSFRDDEPLEQFINVEQLINEFGQMPCVLPLDPNDSWIITYLQHNEFK